MNAITLWRVSANTCSWDEYDSFIVAAHNAVQAVRVAKTAVGKVYGRRQVWSAEPLAIPAEPGVILGSFNAG